MYFAVVLRNINQKKQIKQINQINQINKTNKSNKTKEMVKVSQLQYCLVFITK